MTARLPATLTVHKRPLIDATRTALNAITKHDGATLLYDAEDTAQPLTHAGVLLVGRKVAGWILRTGWSDDNAQDGQPSGEYMETILPAPDYAEQLRHAFPHKQADSYGTLALLRRELHTSSTERTQRETSHSVWSRFACEGLTDAFGLVRVATLNSGTWNDHHVALRGVLIPKASAYEWNNPNARGWECVDEHTAKHRALYEQKPQAFWTLPTFHTGMGTDTDPLVQSLSSSGHEHALTITAALRNGNTLKMQRSYADMSWSGQIMAPVAGGNERPVDFKTYREIIAGTDAYRIATAAIATGVMPDAAAITPSVDEALARAAFTEMAIDCHRRLIALDFVLKAYGVEPATTHHHSSAIG